MPLPQQAPPSYQNGYGATKSDQEPLLEQGGSSGAGWQGDAVEDDFKIGVTVSQSSTEIRLAFVKKVYSILFAMLAATAGVGGVMRVNAVQNFLLSNSWILFASMIFSLVSLLGCMWKRHSYPANMALLATFTVLEAITVGAAVAVFDQVVVLQAICITTFVFIGLTLFTFQSKYDFTSLGPYLMTGVFALIGTGLVGLFVPFSRTVDIVYSALGALIFSGYILYDTHLLLRKLSPDEFILAVISLYLDLINLFLFILRLLSESRD